MTDIPQAPPPPPCLVKDIPVASPTPSYAVKVKGIPEAPPAPNGKVKVKDMPAAPLPPPALLDWVKVKDTLRKQSTDRKLMQPCVEWDHKRQDRLHSSMVRIL